MSFLKKFVEMLTPSSSPGDDGLYVYIKIRRTGEIVSLRLHKGNDISQDDEGRFFVRKLIMGQRSFDKVEATLYFDSNYHVIDSEMSGGEVVDKAAFDAQQSA